MQNRVAPDGELVATAQRGTLLGNRGGRFHGPLERAAIVRTLAMQPEIMLLDEVGAA